MVRGGSSMSPFLMEFFSTSSQLFFDLRTFIVLGFPAWPIPEVARAGGRRKCKPTQAHTLRWKVACWLLGVDHACRSRGVGDPGTLRVPDLRFSRIYFLRISVRIFSHNLSGWFAGVALCTLFLWNFSRHLLNFFLIYELLEIGRASCRERV